MDTFIQSWMLVHIHECLYIIVDVCTFMDAYIFIQWTLGNDGIMYGVISESGTIIHSCTKHQTYINKQSYMIVQSLIRQS